MNIIVGIAPLLLFGILREIKWQRFRKDVLKRAEDAQAILAEAKRRPQ